MNELPLLSPKLERLLEAEQTKPLVPTELKRLLEATKRKRRASKAAHARHSKAGMERAWNYVAPE